MNINKKVILIKKEKEKEGREDKIYTPKDCNSIHRYKEIKSKDEINKDAPKVLNNTIKEYCPEFLFVIILSKFI